MKYELEKYEELLKKVSDLQRYLFMVKPDIEKDYQEAVNIMSANCSPYLDPLAPDPFDADVELLHSIGRVREIAHQMLDLLSGQIQTFIDFQGQKVEKPHKKHRHN